MTWGQADIAILIEFRATHVEAILLNQLLLFYFLTDQSTPFSEIL
jgi:hypothetical protein